MRIFINIKPGCEEEIFGSQQNVSKLVVKSVSLANYYIKSCSGYQIIALNLFRLERLNLLMSRSIIWHEN
jgi:hypothetical protein